MVTIVNPPRNWTLTTIHDSRRQCDNCGTHIRWVFELSQEGCTNRLVGSECVKSHLVRGNADTAVALLAARWKPRRHYYTVRRKGWTWILGTNKHGDWWVGRTRTLQDQFEFFRQTFSTPQKAGRWLAHSVASGEVQL